MTSNAVRSGAFLRGFGLWIKERYPPTVWILSFLFYTSSALFVRNLEAQALGDPSILGWSLADFPKFIAVWSIFLLLRVLDEHKDYEEDCINHPERVLQSGKITLKDLKAVGAVCVVWQLGTMAWLVANAHEALQVWVIAMVWIGLMTKEFFCAAWLKKRLIVYGVSHMVVTPLIVWWVMVLASKVSGSLEAILSPSWLLLPTLSFFFGLLFEIARKTKGAEEERDGVDSYSKSLGNLACTRILIGSAAASGFIALALLAMRPFMVATFPVVIVGIALACWQYLKFYKNPTARMRKHNEAVSALVMIVVYAAYIMSYI
jgi:4-hydroxybenzoate polyprenyltransferase